MYMYKNNKKFLLILYDWLLSGFRVKTLLIDIVEEKTNSMPVPIKIYIFEIRISD